MAAESWQLDQSITRSQAVKINQITKQSNSQIIYKGATATAVGAYEGQDCYAETFGIGIPGISELRRR